MMENIYVDGEVFLSDEVPNTLEESQFCAMHGEAFLSLHALSGHPKNKSIQLRALVKNQAMVILVDSRSSHTFLNSSLANKLHISASTILPMAVRIANGAPLTCVLEAKNFEWWCQGHTF
jgi:hypothetical protein